MNNVLLSLLDSLSEDFLAQMVANVNSDVWRNVTLFAASNQTPR